ncbi:hypothetical protein WJX81_000140 [Elliptochloris bilobata]|uniref:NADP-dependent glyceraldehyde-3-phosphate dehydrogenase n=1 Tax=Elliptochloris bilobata TaxID=381761 RepID=A0AAW1S3J4_9CHLO
MSLLGGPMKASDLFVRALENENVDYIFGVPGEENLDFVESLRSSKRIKLIVTRHEQAAAMMAATVGRLTGKAGVALSTLGPGATNMTTSAAYAQLGGFPTLLITGQKPVLKSKQGAFQIVNSVEMFKPLSKFTKQLVDGGLVPAYVREAVRRAEEERPGASHIELPEDVAHQQVPEEECVVYPAERVRRPVPEVKAVARAVQMIRECAHPLLVVGAGANRKLTSNMLRQFVDEIGIPFCDTMMGKGVIDSRNKMYVGTAAISNGDYIHHAIDHADLIILVGHDVVEKPPFFMKPTDHRRVIHVNFFAASVDSVYFPQHEVVGDIGNGIWQLKEKLKDSPLPVWDLRYFKYVRQEMLKNFSTGTGSCSMPMALPRLVELVRKIVPEDSTLCLDNGLYKVYFARQFPAYTPNSLLLDNALATMGAGLPSAIAAKIVRPSHAVLAIVGDGGYMMASHEVVTAVKLKLHITVLVLNDNAYGMIKWKQAGMHMANFGMDLTNPDFVAHAESMGARGHRVNEESEFADTLSSCLATPAVHIVEVPINYAAGAALQEEALKEHLSKTLLSPDEFFKRSPPPAMNSAEHSQLPKALGKQPPGGGAGEDGPSKESKQDVDGVKTWPFYLGGEPQAPNADLEVYDKYTSKVAYRVAQATAEDIERAIAAAHAAEPAMKALGSWQRKQILLFCVEQFKERKDELAMALCIEAGKPIKDSHGEVLRLIDTFQIAAEESVRMYGEWTPMDTTERNKGFSAIVRKFPVGAVSMVSPFNFPLNLTAHKIAPAIAVGCPFVLKPASRTPIGALIIGEVLAKAPHMPKGAFSILPCKRDGADLFTTDDRLKVLTFTGSPSAGWDMKARAGKKHVVLELGGNAACVVEDFREGELEAMIPKLVFGAFYQSGQSCISVQRALIREDHYSAVRDAWVKAASKLKWGDPKDPETFIGPLISEKEAKRIEEWVQEAVNRGAKVLCGGKRHGAIYEATLLEKVPWDCNIVQNEAFGPVACLFPYDGYKKAVEMVNDSKYGLQAGVFTHDLDKAWYAFNEIVVGGVVINHVPSMRIDAQAYGGSKESGLGREGVRYAMEDYVEIRTMLLSSPGVSI